MPPKCTHGRSYEVSHDGQSITFQPCGLTSHNRADVKFRYCAHCDCFLDDAAFAEDYAKKVLGAMDGERPPEAYKTATE